MEGFVYLGIGFIILIPIIFLISVITVIITFKKSRWQESRLEALIQNDFIVLLFLIIITMLILILCTFIGYKVTKLI